jgi:hypothetical protein
VKTLQVRVRIPVELVPKIEQIRVATGLSYSGEVLLLVLQWYLAGRVGDKETAHLDPDSESSVAQKEIGAKVSEQASRCIAGALSLRDFMRSLAG